MSSNEINMGPVIRMREMLAAAAQAVKPDATGAHALTESYVRLRKEALRIVEENGLPEEEFVNTFPEIDVVEPPDRSEHPRQWMKREVELEALAKQAASLLQQMAGWFDGVVIEYMPDRRMKPGF
jgi:hypothetical protein